MFKTIRTNKFLNVTSIVLTTVTITVWLLTSHPAMLYCGLALSLYWALFFGLYLKDHLDELRDGSYQKKVEDKRKLWELLRSNKVKLRD
ncbi:MAG: hypothetical protein JSU72_18035, partial [Deltaproteobacteria bacterium]